MKLTVSSAELLKGLMDVSKAIPTKTGFPILENFLFSLSGDKLEITASDQELTLKTTLEVENTEEEGEIAVPAKHLTDLLKQLPDQPITIKTVNDNTFECTWNSGSSMLPYYPADDYPKVLPPEEEVPLKLTLPEKTLAEGISGTIYATSDDEIRPAMNGIFFDIAPESTSLVASDSHKLICYTTEDTHPEIKSSFILHRKSAAVIKTLLRENSEDEVEINYGQNKIVINFNNITVASSLIIGNFPNYEVVLPKNNPNILKINRLELLNSVKRVSVCANKASNHIKLEITDQFMEISAQDLGFSIAAHEKLSCEYMGDDLIIGFKSIFLIEILSNLECDNVVIKFADKRRAALIVPSEDDEDYGKIRAIIMPIMIQ